MSVTQTLRALGNWNLSLREDMPASTWELLDYFGHIVIHLGRPDPRIAGDSLLKSARYTGVLRGKSESGMPKQISGLDVAMWLGDPDNKADIVEAPLAVAGDLQTVINAAMAGFDAVTVGTIFNQAGTFEAIFQFQSRRQIVDYIAQTWGGIAWRVNGDATLDVGLESDIFVVNPEVSVMRKLKNSPESYSSEIDMFVRMLKGSLETSQDVEDLTTRVLLLAQGINGQFVSETADAPPGYHPYQDLHGNPIKMTRIIQESDTDAGNAAARAQLQLNRFLGTRDALTLSTEFYDVSGVARVGDYLWVHDPELGLVDSANEVIFQGKRFNPMKLQMTETSWPIVRGMSVAYRHWNGKWVDLTDFVQWETGEASIVVGGYNRSLNEGGSGTFPITLPDVNTTVPGQTQWDLPWVQSQYQSPITGTTQAEVELKWIKPNNTDTTVMQDLDHYDIRYRQSNAPLTDFTLDELATLGDELTDYNTLEEPILLSIEQEWQYATAPAEVLKFRLQQLTPGVTYEAQIRAVDNGKPPNLGAWSVVQAWQASRDIFPPSTPAAPEIAANPMSVLVIHRLGRSDGGEFNLDRDLGHLELHGSIDPLFTPSDDTLIGKIMADWGMITGNIPAVGSFQITQIVPISFRVIAVDQSGNKSNPSVPVVATAELIDDQYVRNLRVDKVTAGTISADWLIGGRITTGGTGARVDITSDGISGYNSLNQRLLNWDNESGKLMVTGSGGIEINDGRLVVRNSNGNIIVELGECADGRHGLQIYRDSGVRVTRVGELQSGSEGIEVINDVGALVRVSTLAFGIAAASVATTQNRAGVPFGDMITVGPSVSVEVGNSGRMVVGVGAWCNNSASSVSAAASFDIAGPSGYFLGASFFRAVRVDANIASGADFTAIGASKFFLIDGLPSAGTYFVTMKYSSNHATNIGQFSDRHLVVIPF